jgi:hypothetical protein
MTCTAETRPETTMTQRILKIAEMEVLRKITNKTRKHRARSENIRKTCKVNNIYK